jgi:hypothetical protein
MIPLDRVARLADHLAGRILAAYNEWDVHDRGLPAQPGDRADRGSRPGAPGRQSGSAARHRAPDGRSGGADADLRNQRLVAG